MNAGQVIALVHRTGATAFVESLGADMVLPLTDGWAQRVREITDDRGVDIVVDPIGGPAFDDALRVLAIDGKLLVIGFTAGAIPSVQVNRLLLRNVGVLGVAWGGVPEQSSRLGCAIRMGVEPTGLPGIKTSPCTAFPVVGGTRGAAVPGGRRGARQGRVRTVAIGLRGEASEELVGVRCERLA